MTSFGHKQREVLPPGEPLLTRSSFDEQRTTADVLQAAERRAPRSKRESDCRDYSEEAVPERDPAYHLPDGTEHDQPTLEVVSAEVRLDLVHRLQQLGM